MCPIALMVVNLNENIIKHNMIYADISNIIINVRFMEGSNMRIDSMDAAFKQTVNVAPTQAGKEPAVKPERSVTDTAGRNNGEDNRYAEEKVSDAFLERAIDKANTTFEIQNRSLRFKIHEKTHEVIVKVVDAETEEVIREIPPEKLLDMFANMLELAGLIVDERR